jgi:hypothetical protein
MISGARYHRVATYSVIKPWFPALLLVPPPGVKLNVMKQSVTYFMEMYAPSCQAKVTYFEFTVRVNKKVARLEIAMEHISTMDVLKSTEGLVKERLEVGVGERLARPDLSTGVNCVSKWLETTYDCMEISLHQFFLR